MVNRAVFLDRDGTIIVKNEFEPNCSSPSELTLLPFVGKGIKLLNDSGYITIVITNQPCIEQKCITVVMLDSIHRKMERDLMAYGARVDATYYCPHTEESHCDCRKPKTKLAIDAIERFDIDVSKSYVIGDWWRDIELGKRIGVKTILVGDYSKKRGIYSDADFVVPSLYDAAKLIVDDGK